MLAQALQRAQYAVQLDTTGSDLSAAVDAYDEAIALLQRVIARRAQKPGTQAEVERVTGIVSPLLLPSETALLTCCLLLLLFFFGGVALFFPYCDIGAR
jgi:hypothetical protein